jgi:spectinomycin phosphotransferase
MLEKPDIQDEKIIACLQAEYGLLVAQVAFLPLGADLNTAVYRAVAADETSYFVKLRRGVFDETAAMLPKWLSDQGIRQIIAPLATTTGQLWASLDTFTLILYPFIAGHNGYEVDLSDRHWGDFGTALKRIHTAAVPPALTRRIPQETYAPQGREIVKTFLERIEADTFADPIAVKLAAFLKARRAEVLDLVGRAERLALALQNRTSEFIVCHSDIHAGNILIDANGALYIVDWDNPILALKERDLMFVGGAQFGDVRTPHEEEALFYRGYGQTQLDQVALAYYRYERIIQDIAIYCEQLFLTDEGGEDREQALHYFMSNFLPNGTIAIAYQADKTLRDQG